MLVASMTSASRSSVAPLESGPRGATLSFAAAIGVFILFLMKKPPSDMLDGQVGLVVVKKKFQSMWPTEAYVLRFLSY
jgi:hypothetical protein